MNTTIVPQTKTMNEATPLDQTEYALLTALAMLIEAKERISNIGYKTRGEQALRLADTQGALIYAIKEAESAVAYFTLAQSYQ